MKPLFWLFDMDDTLVDIIDRQKDKDTLYMTLDYQQFNKTMMKIFNGCKQYNPLHVGILTSRHPDLRKEIQKKFELVHVWTRDFCLTKDEIITAISSLEETDKFYTQAVDRKINVMKMLVNNYTPILFDDLAYLFWNNPKLHKDIIVMLPVDKQSEYTCVDHII